ncbi:retrovirus-related pol polyprotein from transposon TNT 1-94 [Tanacetum coccineum]
MRKIRLWSTNRTGLVDQDNPNLCTRSKKALYGLKQALCAWYDLLSKFLLSQEFSKGTVDPTLFIRRQGKDILMVQIYVDDIIFASTTPVLWDSGIQRMSFIALTDLQMLIMRGLQDTDEVHLVYASIGKQNLLGWSSKGRKRCAIQYGKLI